MLNIRQGVFETNSSSTHAIVIPHVLISEYINELKSWLNEYDKLKIHARSYGWEHQYYTNFFEKVEYIYTMFCVMDNYIYFEEYMRGLLNKHEIFCDIEFSNENDYYHIDHEDQLNLLYRKMIVNPQLIENFILSPLSFIVTGNDQDDEYKITDAYMKKNHPDILNKNFTIYFKDN